MRGLLIVTMLTLAVLVLLPPAGEPGPQPSGSKLLSAVVLLFGGLRDLLYGVGELAVSAAEALWEFLPERLKPLLGLLVLIGGGLSVVGWLALTGARSAWRRFTN